MSFPPDAAEPDLGPGLPLDYTRCVSDVDCPINGSRCVTLLPMSRVDQNGNGEVLLSDVFDELAPGEGVCSEDCTNDSTVCDTVLWPNDRGTPTASICTVVAVGAKPHEIVAVDPFDVIFDRGEVELGQSFASICMPDFAASGDYPPTFCQTCSASSDCGAEATCVDLGTGVEAVAGEQGTTACLSTCAVAQDCPLGFSCVNDHCAPDQGTCSDCIDRDGDGFGTGNCGTGSERVTEYDCDDSDPTVYYDESDLYHSFPAQCGMFDSNCDGARDDLQQVGTQAYGAFHCTTCGDACSGPVANGEFRCTLDATNTPECVPGCLLGSADCDPNIDGCETLETDPDHLYYEDLDQDGYGDAASAGGQFFCDASAAAGVLTNPVLDNSDCDDASAARNPGATEYCDGVDSNCTRDTDPTDPAVVAAMGEAALGSVCDTGKLGVCGAGTEACTAAGQVCLQAVASAAEVCDGLDNDCDGTPDDGVTTGTNGTSGDVCTVTFPFGAQYDASVNACRDGVLTCSGSATLDCVSTGTPTEEAMGFDGIDSNCDGHDRYFDEANGRPHAIFVAPNISGGDGTPQSPYGRLSEAAYEAAGCYVPLPNGGTRRCDVFLAEGDYQGAFGISMRPGVDVYGGFAVNSGWSAVDGSGRMAAATTAPDTSVSTVINVGIRYDGGTSYIGLIASGVTTPTMAHNFTVVTPDETLNGSANFGAQIDSSPGLVLDTITLIVGKGGPGQSGTAALVLPDAEQNLYPIGNVRFGDDNDPYPRLKPRYAGVTGCLALGSGVGGTNATAPVYAPPDGEYKDGGTGGNGSAFWPPVSSGAQFVTGGAGSVSVARSLDSTLPSKDAADGSGGNAAANANARTPGTLVSVTSVQRWNAGSAGAGRRNQGGAGGGGGGYVYYRLAAGAGTYWRFGATQRGAGGGCPGRGGTGGTDGGPSVGMLVRNMSALQTANVVIEPSSGGDGGDGGNGAAGAKGADGGGLDDPGYDDFPESYAGHGGHGAGGNGGDGGLGGRSIGLWRLSASVVGNPTIKTTPLSQGGRGGTGGTRGGLGATTSCVADALDNTCTKRVADDGYSGQAGDDGNWCPDLQNVAFGQYCTP